MKKSLWIVALAALTISCGNKNKNGADAAVEAYSDSIYMVNDSTIGEMQTYVYEGMLPMENGLPGNYVLTINSYGMNADGTYSLTESYTEGNGAGRVNQDAGEKMVLIGIPNDSTAIVYELISYNNRPKMRLKAYGDSILTKVDKDFKKLSDNPKHRLARKK